MHNLRKVAGSDGGEPGSDDPNLPRPVDSRRVMSAGIDGTEYRTLIYASSASPADVTAKYEDDMIHRGWIRVNPDPGDDANMNRGYLKDGKAVLVGAQLRQSKDASGKVPKQTIVAVAEIGGTSALEMTKKVGPKSIAEVTE